MCFCNNYDRYVNECMLQQIGLFCYQLLCGIVVWLMLESNNDLEITVNLYIFQFKVAVYRAVRIDID